MFILNKFFNILHYKKLVPVVLLSCVSLIGCSNSNTQSESPKQTNQANQIKQENTGNQSFAKLEKEYDAKLGIYVLDTGTNQTVAYHSDDRFAFASTSKSLAVGALLRKNSLEALDQRITYTHQDLSNYNPITEKHVDTGMTLKELADASVRYSDSTAHPEAIAKTLQSFTLGTALPIEKRELLVDWMKRNTTGDKLIRAGVPKGWEVADKTGAGSYGTRNDIAIIWPPNKKPIVLAILSNHDKEDAKYDDKLIADATKVVLNTLKATE
ncbi:serine hydrolase [Bacillus toyonensis]|uniref:Beta-lactamase n=1 Tax=Bacillus toyonensis TaxID=155322 RepID=A0A2A8HHI3_9BACI|nr:serine hydrolase [Bacillus toyonensis]PEQ08591.1 class A beta-lactamase [Bacillus toyonensis]